MGIAGGHPCDMFGAFAQISTTPDLANWLAIMCDLLLCENNRRHFACSRVIGGVWPGPSRGGEEKCKVKSR